MSEKRFVIDEEGISDKKIDKWYCWKEEVVDLLNEQQAIISTLKEENKELKHWKKRMVEYLSDWFAKTEYLSVSYKINEINNEIGLDSDE